MVLLVEDFEKVIASVALIFRCNPTCKLYVTYQLRRYQALRLRIHRAELS